LSGELLPDWYDDWVVLERERLREVHFRALEAYCDRLISSSCFDRATEAALAAINDDPMRESAHRCLIRVHLAEGNEAKAVCCYRLFRKRLQGELGNDPLDRQIAILASPRWVIPLKSRRLADPGRRGRLARLDAAQLTGASPVSFVRSPWAPGAAPHKV
jgi:DNA-binding SARP family transcriptional activator